MALFHFNLRRGEIGLNVLGFYAGVGLTGAPDGEGGAVGRIYASAGTPFGQNAFAGLGGRFCKGKSYGEIFAAARATPEIEAKSGMAAQLENGNISGEICADATALPIAAFGPDDLAMNKFQYK